MLLEYIPLLVIGGLFLLLQVWVCIAMFRGLRSWMSTPCPWKPIDPAALAPPIRSRLDAAADALRKLGFEPRLYVSYEMLLGKASWLQVLAASESRELPLVSSFIVINHVRLGTRDIVNHSFEFSTKKASGDTASTTNQPGDDRLDGDQVATIRAPSLRDPRILLEAHTRRMARDPSPTKPNHLTLESVRAIWDRSVHAMRLDGRYEFATDGLRHRIRMLPALKIALGAIFPLSSLNLRRQKRAERQSLADLGIDNATQQAAAQFLLPGETAIKR